MVLSPNFTASGCHRVTEEEGRLCVAGMDFSVLTLKRGESWQRPADGKECALLLVEGSVEVSAASKVTAAARPSVFVQNGWAWHLPCGEALKVTALANAELLVMAAHNATAFAPKIYNPHDVKVQRFGEGQWDNTGLREVLTFFDYNNAPYSKLVLGEVFALPGRWTSYPPHYHPQPEVYYYRMDKPQGFGAAFLEDQSYTIKDRNVFIIPGGMTHPQCVGAGYSLYFAWVIKHLPDNPWTERIFHPAHAWLMEENTPLWQGLNRKKP